MSNTEIAARFDISCERVRKIVQKVKSEKPELKEDKYKNVFLEYTLSKNQFCCIKVDVFY